MGQQKQRSLSELCSNDSDIPGNRYCLLPQTTLHEQAQIIYSNTCLIYWPAQDILVLITLLSNECSGESEHMPRLTYAQTCLSLCCLHTQSMDVDEDSWVFIGGNPGFAQA